MPCPALVPDIAHQCLNGLASAPLLPHHAFAWRSSAAEYSAPSGLGGYEMERSYSDATNASSVKVTGISGAPRARS